MSSHRDLVDPPGHWARIKAISSAASHHTDMVLAPKGQPWSVKLAKPGTVAPHGANRCMPQVVSGALS